MLLRRVSYFRGYSDGAGFAVAVIAFASQSAQLTHRDSPIAVILFATSSILLFTLPRVGGNSKLPHLAILVFGLSTVLAYLFGVHILAIFG